MELTNLLTKQTMKIIDSPKTITFRHLLKVESIFGSVSDEVLKGKLVEDCFSRGYVPLDIKFETYELTPFQKVRRCSCWCGYAGKKQARIMGIQNSPKIINIYP